MPELPDAVLRILALHDNVISRRQLLAAGVTPEGIRWNAGRHWRIVLPGVFLLSREAPRERQKQIAALLWAGPASVLAGSTAAWLHGVEAAALGGPLQVLVPTPQDGRQHGFVTVRRTTLFDPDIVVRGPMRLSSRARSCVDACLETRSPTTRAAILIEAVQKNLATQDDLSEWVDRLRPRDASKVRPALDQAATDVWSVPESELLALVQKAPWAVDLWCNPVLTTAAGAALPTPDLWADEVAMAVMVHSHRFHAAGDDWDQTVESDDRLRAAGVEVVGLTPRRIRSHPHDVLARLTAAFERAAHRPRPAVHALLRGQAQRRLAG